MNFQQVYVEQTSRPYVFAYSNLDTTGRQSPNTKTCKTILMNFQQVYVEQTSRPYVFT